ncbi:MAG: HD domain-containing protein [Lachnospiraceae bacterium]|nr:HD domain-containing protein [Lachnospiraceae bacterium]
MDADKVKNSFNNYVSSYNPKDVKIRLKIEHTYFVAAIAKKIAASLSLEEYDIYLAWLLGMLHDIGRFEQVRRYGTFNDKASVDHAGLGADILFKEELIKGFVEDGTREYGELDLIETAVRTHSLFRLPEDLDTRTKMFCNILRDADKVDIFRVQASIPFEDIYSEDKKKDLYFACARDEIMNYVRAHSCIPRMKDRNAFEIIVSHLALAFELVYKQSRIETLEQGYILKMLEFESQNEIAKNQMKFIKKEIMDTLNN